MSAMSAPKAETVGIASSCDMNMQKSFLFISAKVQE